MTHQRFSVESGMEGGTFLMTFAGERSLPMPYDVDVSVPQAFVNGAPRPVVAMMLMGDEFDRIWSRS